MINIYAQQGFFNLEKTRDMKYIAFDLEKASAGCKVVTKCGRPVRILCTDRKESDYPIVALVENEDGCETAEGYTLEGRYDIEYSLDMDLCLEVEDDYLTADELEVLEKHVTREGVSGALAKILTDNGIEWYRECDKENDGSEDSNEPTKMFIEEFGDYVKTALWGLWKKSDKSGVCNVRYSVQCGVIYDCVSGKEIALDKVIDEVVKALNYKSFEVCSDLSRTGDKVEGLTANKIGI